MKDIKIGEEIRIRCVENDERDTPFVSCQRCFLYPCGEQVALCSGGFRTDRKNVHFELVENDCPSDETIMRVLNCIGYEERSWIDTVKENWSKV